MAAKLVDYYISKLIEEPKNHDKVEFEIVISCFTFDIQDRLNKLREKGFSIDEQEDLKEELRKLTNNIINTKSGLWKVDSSYSV